MIVVTGGFGFIGSHLVRRLNATPVGLPFHDLRDLAVAQRALQGATEIYHLAADMGGVGYNSRNLLSIASNNTLIDLNVFSAAEGKVLYASSATVYPGNHLGPLNEQVAPSPDPGYGWAKLYGEKLASYYENSRVVRFQNVYGPGQLYEGPRAPALASLCRKVIQAKNGDEIEVWGDGSQVRDFTYVDDAVEGMIRVMKQEHQGPINVATGVPTTVKRLAEQIIEVSGKWVRIKFDLTKPAGATCRYADTTKLRTLAGWTAQTSLKDGLKKTYEAIESSLLSPAPRSP